MKKFRTLLALGTFAAVMGSLHAQVPASPPSTVQDDEIDAIIRRDLKLTNEQLALYKQKEALVMQRGSQLRSEVGSPFAGSYLHLENGNFTFVVLLSDPRAAGVAQKYQADLVKVVRFSLLN